MNPARLSCVLASALITAVVAAYGFPPMASGYAAIMWGGTAVIFSLTRRL